MSHQCQYLHHTANANLDEIITRLQIGHLYTKGLRTHTVILPKQSSSHIVNFYFIHFHKIAFHRHHIRGRIGIQTAQWKTNDSLILYGIGIPFKAGGNPRLPHTAAEKIVNQFGTVDKGIAIMLYLTTRFLSL